jgi:hypothetical protein
MPRFFADLGLGARLALIGGPDARWRAALTAGGVALGVTLLLFAASVPHMVSDHNHRLAARAVVASPMPGHLLILNGSTTYHGDSISVDTIQRTSERLVLPPGIDRLPKPGEMLASPALASLLRSDRSAALRRRLHSRIVGTISPSGLAGPAELFAYRGAGDLSDRPYVTPVKSFGVSGDNDYQGPIISILVILMVVALLLPIGVFVATASRFGSEQRNVRLAALRLLGADRLTTARIAAGEALLGASVGVLAGIALFTGAVRPVIQRVHIAGISVFTSDVRPSVALAVLAILLVPAASVVFALLAMRGVAIEPLGVTRHGRPPKRRLVWRLITPIFGFILLLPLLGSNERLGSTGGQIEASAGVVFVLVGVCALLPWLVEAAVARAGDGSLPWLLAVRRLRADHGTSGRVVGAIALTVAGAIALQTVFSAADASEKPAITNTATGNTVQLAGNTVEIEDLITDHPDPVRFVVRKLDGVPTVGRPVVRATVDPYGKNPIAIAPCTTLTKLARIGSCNADSSFIVGAGTGLRPGGTLREQGDLKVRLPDSAQVVRSNPPLAMGIVASLGPSYSVLMTPQAAAKLGVQATYVSAVADLKSTPASAGDQLRDAVASIDPLASVNDVTGGTGSHLLASLRHALVAGATAVLLVIGLSLLVAAAEQLRERRRVLAVLAAFGTKRSTLALSILWQTALPVAIGLVLAIILGTALGAILLKVVSLPVAFDWGAVALLVGAGALVIAMVTGLTMPMLWRQMRADALRAE